MWYGHAPFTAAPKFCVHVPTCQGEAWDGGESPDRICRWLVWALKLGGMTRQPVARAASDGTVANSAREELVLDNANGFLKWEEHLSKDKHEQLDESLETQQAIGGLRRTARAVAKVPGQLQAGVIVRQALESHFDQDPTSEKTHLRGR